MIKEDGIRKETSETPAVLTSTMDSVSKIADISTGEPREPGNRGLACGFVTAEVVHSLRQKGAEAFPLQTNNLYFALNGTAEAIPELLQSLRSGNRDDETFRIASRAFNEANQKFFQHTVTVAKIDGRFFLIDLTYCQFEDEDSDEIGDGSDTSRLTRNSNVVRSLDSNGYVEITPANIIEIIQAVSFLTEEEIRDQIKEKSFEELMATVNSLHHEELSITQERFKLMEHIVENADNEMRELNLVSFEFQNVCTYILHISKLISEAKTNPNFDLDEEKSIATSSILVDLSNSGVSQSFARLVHVNFDLFFNLAVSFSDNQTE